MVSEVTFEGHSIDAAFPGERFLWVIQEPYAIHWQGETGPCSLLVPKGFVTDLASVPRPLWSLFSPWDNWLRDAAIVHDRAYATQEVEKAVADELLYYGMLTRGSRATRAWAVYAAVKVGGYYSYRTGPERQAEYQRRLAAAISYGLLCPRTLKPISKKSTGIYGLPE